MKKKQKKRKSNINYVDLCFRGFFILSLSVVSFLVGVSAAIWELSFLTWIYTTFAVLIAFFIGTSLGKKKIQASSMIVWLPLLVVAYFSGFCASSRGIADLDSWMEGSVREAKIMFSGSSDPFSDKGESDLNDSEQEEVNMIVNDKQDLKVNFDGIPYPMFISFDSPQKFMLINDTPNGAEFKLLENKSEERMIPMIVEGDKLFLETMSGGPTEGKDFVHAVIKGGQIETVWKKNTKHGFHHWGDYDGKYVYMPANKFINLPDKRLGKLKDTQFGRCVRKDAISSKVVVMEADTGKEVKVIEILPRLANYEDMPWELGVYLADNCKDILHMNDARVLKTEQEASYFPNGKVGDILVSLRNVHTVLLLDRDTTQIKWHVFGKFHQQHSPRVTDRGTLIIFDNLGSNPANGTTRLVEIDIATREVVGIYEATGDDFFYSKIRGRITIIDGRIFVAAHESANVFEVICEDTKYLDPSCKQQMVLERSNIMRKYFLADFIKLP